VAHHARGPKPGGSICNAGRCGRFIPSRDVGGRGGGEDSDERAAQIGARVIDGATGRGAALVMMRAGAPMDLLRRSPRSPASRPAFGEVAEEHLGAVLRYLVHLVGDRDLAEDLTGATFEAALRSWPRYDPARGTPLAWLCQIARGRALDHFRREGRRRAREERYAAGEGRAVAAPDAGGGLPPDLRRAMGLLTPAESEVVALRVLLELDGAETARVLGISPSAVSSLLHRALTRLRREVSP
jgi:RNA polymerase sigma-70 factor (ECF subfamily)